MIVQQAFIYFIRCGEFIKIGTSTNPKRRLKGILSSNPFPCEIIGIVEGGLVLEAEIHEALAKDRHRGEWFHATDSVTNLIQRLVSIDPWVYVYVEPEPEPEPPVEEPPIEVPVRSYKPKPRQWNFR